MAPQKIMVDYDKLPIRCRICLSWKHKASECKESMKRPKYVIEKGRSAYPHNNQQMEKGKTIEIDENGFQQVKHRKNTRRNIFDKNTMDPGITTTDLRMQSPSITFGATATAAAQQNQKVTRGPSCDVATAGPQCGARGGL